MDNHWYANIYANHGQEEESELSGDVERKTILLMISLKSGLQNKIFIKLYFRLG